MLFTKKQWKYLIDGYHLTPRQAQIVKYICEGSDNTQIAKKCKIKYNTVKAHITNICNRVSVRGKSELILQLLKVAKRAK